MSWFSCFPRTPSTNYPRRYTLPASQMSSSPQYPDALIRLDAVSRILSQSGAVAADRLPRDALVGASCAAALAAATPDGAAFPSRDGLPPLRPSRSVSGLPDQPFGSCNSGVDELPVFLPASYQRYRVRCGVGALLAMRSAARRGPAGSDRDRDRDTVSHELRSRPDVCEGYPGLLLSRWTASRTIRQLEMLAQVNHDADRLSV